MTDGEVEKIIRSNMNLQMNLAGIRADFEEKLQRTWVGLTDEEIESAYWNYMEIQTQNGFEKTVRVLEANSRRTHEYHRH